MRLKPVLFFVILFLDLGINAQTELECKAKLSIFHEAVKANKYDDAYEPWKYVKTNCPSLSLAIYADGEKILKYKIDNTQDNTRIEHIKDLLTLWNGRKQYFKNKTSLGAYGAKTCQLQFDYKDELGLNTQKLFDCFDVTFNTDKKTFAHPKSLYTYFSLVVDLFDKGKKTDAELFNTYDDVSEKIQVEIQNYSEKLNALISKLESAQKLSRKDLSNKKVYESYLKNYTLIQDGVDAKLGIRANCKNLIPLYLKDFEIHQNDSIWLKRAVSRMYHKECTEDALYEKLVKQYDKVAPSADTKIYVATILFKKRKDDEAYKYLEEGYKLETNLYKKSNLAIKIGVILKNKGHFTKSRAFLWEALKLNAANGKPHLIIAQMYAESAKNKNCGKDNFHQRAIYWLAAKEAKKASRVDPTLKKIVNQSVANYEAMAPTKEEIFLSGLSGKTIKIECWIKESVVVPKVD